VDNKNIDLLYSSVIRNIIEYKKKGKKEEEIKKELYYSIGAAFVIGLIKEKFKNIKCKSEKLQKAETALKLFTPEEISDAEELIQMSFLETEFEDYFYKSGFQDDVEDIEKTCKTCIYSQKQRPDKIKMRSTFIWCKKLGREMPVSTSYCRVGKWGFFTED